MKPAYYMLAAVLIALALSAVLVAVQFSNTPASSVPPRQAVYIDLDLLARDCPAHVSMRGLAAGGGRVLAAHKGRSAGADAVKIAGPDQTAFRWARQHLEFVTAEAAVVGLRRLEVLRNRSADLNLEAMRAAAAERAEAEAEAEIVRLAHERADGLRQAANDLAAERVNAEMKVGALRAALKVETPDRPSLEAMLAAAQSNLKSVDARLNDEASRIENVWRDRVDALSRTVSEQVDSEISAHAAQVKSRIESEISRARTELLSSMGSNSVGSSLSGVSAAVSVHRVRRDSLPTHRSASTVRVNPASVRLGIRNAVARQAAIIAERHGWRAVFVRTPGIPDRTGSILREMRRIWNAAAPASDDGAV